MTTHQHTAPLGWCGQLTVENCAGIRCRKLLLVACGLAVGMLAAELGLRVVGFHYPIKTVRCEFSGYTYRPAARWIQTSEGHAEVRINKFGFRDKDWVREKPPNTIRIAVLGDSFVAGLEVEEHKCFTTIIENELRASSPFGDANIETLNFGLSGHGTAQELMTLRHKVWQFDPDLVLLAFLTANDIRNNVKELEREPLFPYFVVSQAGLVLDDSFRQQHHSWPVRSLKRVADYSRTAQLIYRWSHSRARARWRMENQSSSGTHAALDEFGFSDPATATKIYLEPQDATWDNAWRVTEAILVETKKEVAAHDAQLLLVTLSNDIQVHPDAMKRDRFVRLTGCKDLFYADKRIKAIGDRHGIPTLNLAPELLEHAERHSEYVHGFENTRLGWGHWNERGHRLAGKLIAKWIRREAMHEPSNVVTK